MSDDQITNVMHHFEIPRCWHRAFCCLINDGAIDDRNFSRFIRRDPEFKAAVEMSLDFLSADYAHLFSDAFVADTGRAQEIAGNF